MFPDGRRLQFLYGHPHVRARLRGDVPSTPSSGYNIHFVRGRISEASPTLDGRVQIKAEDTLTGRPLKMSVDMLVLIVGMRSNASNARFAAGAGLWRAAERVPGAPRRLSSQCRERRRRNLLRRSGHCAQEYRRIVVGGGRGGRPCGGISQTCIGRWRR